MLSKRVVACLDVKDGQLAKSIKFVDTQTIGDPVAKARQYYQEGLDELVFYDITASSDNRNIMLDVVANVAQEIFIPFSVGLLPLFTQYESSCRCTAVAKVATRR